MTTNDLDDYINRLKSRYARDNSVLDLINLVEKLREENRVSETNKESTHK